jgi:ferredoxin
MEEQKKKVARIEIDKKACIGCGTCVVASPKAFDIGEEGFSIVKDSWKEEGDENLINTARLCPSGAIILFDEKGNKIEL